MLITGIETMLSSGHSPRPARAAEHGVGTAPLRAEPLYPDLRDKRVLVTGGATGIGAAITAAFARQGCRVAFVDVLEEEGLALAAALAPEVDWKPAFLPCDISRTADLDAVFLAAREAHGDVQILVNNAANDARHRLEDLSEELWDARMAVNLRAAIFASRLAADEMRRAGGGSILNFGSIAWKLKMPDMIAYTTAKAALLGATRTLARALGAGNVRVNLITPGWVMTERQRLMWLTPEAEAEIDSGQCLKLRVQPDHIAAMALFLGSDASIACTAQEFVVDAGWS